VQVQRANEEDVDIAVAAARTAFKSWRDVPGTTRRDLMLKLADLLERDKQLIAEIESLDNGKPVSVARDVDIGTFLCSCLLGSGRLSLLRAAPVC